MALWPKHNNEGYFLGSLSDGGGPRPHLTADQDDWPEELEGYIARRKKDAQGRWARGWDQIENHKGEHGYVNGEPYTIKDYGPYPDGWSPTPPPPTPEEEAAAQQAAFTAAIQARLDDFARTRNYDNALSCASYATSTNPKFAAEGQYIVAARYATWAKGYEILNAVLAGDRPMPTLEEVMAELPPLVWPEA